MKITIKYDLKRFTSGAGIHSLPSARYAVEAPAIVGDKTILTKSDELERVDIETAGRLKKQAKDRLIEKIETMLYEENFLKNLSVVLSDEEVEI